MLYSATYPDVGWKEEKRKFNLFQKHIFGPRPPENGLQSGKGSTQHNKITVAASLWVGFLVPDPDGFEGKASGRA